MFDFANSSYTTVIITVIFCIIFPKIIVGDAPEYRLGNLLWSTAISISYLIVLLTAPILGAIMDYSASKKVVKLSCALWFKGRTQGTDGYCLQDTRTERTFDTWSLPSARSGARALFGLWRWFWPRRLWKRLPGNQWLLFYWRPTCKKGGRFTAGSPINFSKFLAYLSQTDALLKVLT